MWDILSRLRQRRLHAARVDEQAWRDALGSCRYAQLLPIEDQARLRALAGQFLADKAFSGAHGLEITGTMRTHIALHACLPVLRLGLEYYRNWRGIVVYPGDFRVRRSYEDEAGVVHEGMEDLCGESLAQGPMVLSWESMLSETQAPDLDLVIHECAHKLDVLNGEANGFPPLHETMAIADWSREWRTGFEDFSNRVANGEDTLIDPYAATDPAEFFAVMSETFFTAPRWIQDGYSGIYAQLRSFYRQDTLALFDGQ